MIEWHGSTPNCYTKTMALCTLTMVENIFVAQEKIQDWSTCFWVIPSLSYFSQKTDYMHGQNQESRLLCGVSVHSQALRNSTLIIHMSVASR